MIDKIVVTYSPYPEKLPPFEEWVINGLLDGGIDKLLEDITKSSEDIFPQNLFVELSELIPKVTIYDDVLLFKNTLGNPQKAFELLSQNLETADLLFHSGIRISKNLANAQIKPEDFEGYIREFDTLIHKHFLHKTHFSSQYFDYTDKRPSSKFLSACQIPVPNTYSVDEALQLNNFPVVLKIDVSSCGEHVYLIQSKEVLEKFFYLEKKGLSGPSYSFVPEKKDCMVQEYIESPSDYNTHYGIFTLGDGTIVGAALFVSNDKKGQNVWEMERQDAIEFDGKIKVLDLLYRVRESPFFIDSPLIQSNTSRGGRQIPLYPLTKDSIPISKEDKLILEQHGINPNNITLPKELEYLSKKAAIELQKNGVIYGRSDWMQDRKDKFNFLEINDNPGIQLFNTLFFQGKLKEELTKSAAKKLAYAIQRYEKN